MTRCLMCRERFAICAETFETDDGEICRECNDSLPETLRPSLGFVPSLLRSVARGETERNEP